jgi:hypothetical protein
MKWRARLAILLGLLLPVPLIWASSTLLLGGLNASETHEDGSRVVPILPPDETRRLPTFERSCQRNEDCDAPLACLRGQFMLKKACVASTCATDMDCSEGLSCHSIAAGERMVRLCGAPGKATEGEFCMELPVKRNMACAPELLCTHKQCRRPCQPQEPRSCPEGFFCSTADVKGPVCLPTCKGFSCPDGQRCVALEHGVSICARVHGMDCQLNPCPADQVCEVAAREFQNGVWMKCMRSCDTQARQCPEGFSCMSGRCIQRCNSNAPGTCGPMEECVGLSEDHPGLCVFDFDE